MVLACTQPEGFVENTSDCDDSALTYEDLDGDGFGSEVTVACGVLVSGDCDDTMLLFEDLDNDGFGGQEYAACGMMVSDDCDDSDPTVSPAGNEICNTLDDNCNGEIDEGVLSTFYHDADLDGFGDINSIVLACEPAEGYVNNAEDCDDTQLTYIDNDGDSFGGSEWAACGVSNADDCDDNVLTYLDTDGDGFGSTNLDACGVFNFDDCDDANTEINPSVQEICNQLDDNCNIEVDENVLISFYADMDNDGFGDINNTVQACILMPGYVDNGLDCDDGQLLYSDLDSDGFGGQVLDACGVATNSDCIDFDDSVNPGAVELCDNIDQNCNGVIDEGLLLPFYQDADADGYGDINAMIEACAAATGYVSDSTDCNDADAQINPGMAEIADNNIDENCDGQIATLIAESKIEMNIFPNPAALQAVIEKSNGELGNLKVYDVMGNQVLNIMVNASRYTMETADWSNGIYLIEMGTEKYRLTVSH
jgi:hypothetical protein